MKRFLFLILALLLGMSQVHAQDPQRLEGVLAYAVYDTPSRQLIVSGWALAGEDGHSPPKLVANIRGSALPVPDVEWSEREDLFAANPAMNGKKGLAFTFHMVLPFELPKGPHTLRVDAVFPDGAQTPLRSVEGPHLTLRVEGVLTRHMWLAGLALVIAALIQGLAVRFRGRSSPSWLRGRKGHAAIIGVFLILVLAGVTGSSLGVMFSEPVSRNLWSVDASPGRLFKLRGIRGDESRVLMPNVLAQIHHEPPFPVVNRNIGLEGQNMGVIGMTGVPIAQWAALARPATWGYFVLPMRQAMAWQWQLPFWGCLLALWCLLNFLRPGHRGVNLALSGVFCVAPYAAAWSNWPLYATMFPVAAFLVVCKLMTTREAYRAAGLGLVLGWLLACWVLVLYPPWLVIAGSVLGFLGVGWCMDQRAHLRFGRAQVGGLVLACLVALSLLGSWWVDTREAIALMQATVYPGARGTLTGGGMNWWWHLRGYHNAETVPSLAGPNTNQSEVSSYFYLPLLWMALAVVNWSRAKGRRFTLLACFLFVACYWYFSMAGVSPSVAKYTLWGHMPTGRMELGMGLASVFFFALLANAAKPERWQRSVGVPALMAIANTVLVVWAINSTPDALLPAGDWLFTATMAGMGALVCWWLLRGQVDAGVAMLATIHLMASLHFNPIVRAPRAIELAAGHRPYATSTGENGRLLKILAIDDSSTGPLAFAAVGLPVINGVLYYPHTAFWQRIGLPETDWKVVNRYQHLVVILEVNLDTPSKYRISSPIVDQVHVHVNPELFDFSRIGVERVAALSKYAFELKKNSSLRWIGSYNDINWFSVFGVGD